MKEIPLTQGKVALVDDGDYRRLSGHKWCAAIFTGGRWYAVRAVVRGGRKTTALMHREVLGFQPGDPDVDHWDGDGLNNQRENLRPATGSENVANQTARSECGFKGVYRISGNRPRKKPWVVIIKGRYYGTSSEPAEAARIYDAAARSLYGEFACLNFPRPGERSALTGKIEPLNEAPAEAAA